MSLADKLKPELLDPAKTGDKSRNTPRTCERKRKLARSYAVVEARRLWSVTGKKFNAYRCDHCGFWHVGKPWTGGKT